MKLIAKRLLANLIDIILYLFILVVFAKIAGVENNRSGFDFTHLSTFLLVFVLPITAVQNTFGGIISNIKYEGNFLGLKLFIKYLIYSSLIIRTPNYSTFLTESLSTFLNINIISFFWLRLEIVSVIISTFCFLFSSGKYNLLDYIFTISIESKEYKKRPVKNYTIYSSILFLLLFSSVLEFNLSAINRFEIYTDKLKDNFITEYYPKEEFSDFLMNKGLVTSLENTNNIITASDFSTYFMNKNHLQKTIKALINSETYNSEQKRLKLLNKIVGYSNFNNIQSENDIFQTRIILIYVEPTTILTKKLIWFNYYYDNINPYKDIYGGINASELYDELVKIDATYWDSCYQSISKALNVPKDSVRAFYTRGQNKIYSDTMLKDIDIDPFEFEINSKVEIKTIKFEETTPNGMYYFSFLPFGEPYMIHLENEAYPDYGMDSLYWIKQNYAFSK